MKSPKIGPADSAVAQRLQGLLKSRKRSIRSLAIALKSQGIAGASYGNVYAIVDGRSRPSLDWLQAAAKVLGVSAARLTFGTGPRAAVLAGAGKWDPERQTALQERVGALLRTAKSRASLEEAVQAAFYEGFRENDPAAWAIAAPVWYVLADQRGEKRAAAVTAARMLGKALRTPLEAVGLKPESLETWQRDHVLALLALALRAALQGSN